MSPFPPPAVNAVTSMAYPRTGKRGVPQQFPRRLYEMLQGEAKLAETEPGHVSIITWSTSGKAFRIIDVSKFSSEILPKYFRTSKFSSFQRNLNLYGFCKVRRGPDTDMYAHPSFVRGVPDSLANLRKCNSTAARKRATATHERAAPELLQVPENTFTRTVSPATPGGMVMYHHIMPLPVDVGMNNLAIPQHAWPPATPPVVSPTHAPVSPGAGKLDLLALAMTSMAERDSQLGQSAAIQTAQ